MQRYVPERYQVHDSLRYFYMGIWLASRTQFRFDIWNAPVCFIRTPFTNFPYTYASPSNSSMRTFKDIKLIKCPCYRSIRLYGKNKSDFERLGGDRHYFFLYSDCVNNLKPISIFRNWLDEVVMDVEKRSFISLRLEEYVIVLVFNLDLTEFWIESKWKRATCESIDEMILLTSK